LVNKKEVIRLFLKNGFQISKNALPLALNNPGEIIHDLKTLRPRPFIITEKHIRKILKKTIRSKIEIETLKVYKRRGAQIRIEDCIKFFRSRYEKTKNILSKHMSHEKLISINKTTKQTSTFSIIGIVRNKNDNNLLLEDLSSQTHVFFDETTKEELKNVVLDDVVGIKCKKIKEKIYGQKIIFPDILSSRKINKTEHEINVAFISSPGSLEPTKYQKLITLLSKNKNSLLIFLFMSEKNKKIFEDFSNFKYVHISPNSNPTIFRINNIKIMVFPKHFFNQHSKILTPMNFMISILRKRLLPTNSDLKKIDENGFVLEDAPDIVVSNFDESSQKNYKGTTIISNSDSEKIFLINLKNREVFVKSV